MKNTFLHICLAIVALFVLSSCTQQQQKPQTIENYNLNESFEQCKTSASEMNDGAKNSNNPLWNSYFEMCMSSKGYQRADYKHLWY